MTSAIDATKPVDAVPASKADLRANLAAAKSEIEALQVTTAALTPYAFSGMRNRLYNPLFRMDRRNGAALVSVPAGSTYKFTVDRWFGTAIAGGGTFSVQSVQTGPTDIVSAVRMATTTAKGGLAAGDLHYFGTALEGNDWLDLQWGTSSARGVTLSFWARSSLTGTFSVALHSTGYGVSYVGTYSITVANTWQYKTIVIPGPTIGTWGTTAATSLGLKFDLGCGSTFQGAAGVWTAGHRATTSGSVSLITTLSATLDIAAIQLEVGSVATSFERRVDSLEVLLTGRYYENLQFNLAGYNTIGAVMQHVIQAVIYKRATPTITLTSSAPTNLTAPITTAIGGQGGFLASATVTATGAWTWSSLYAIDSEITI